MKATVRREQEKQVSLIVTVPEAPEVSEIATALFRARVNAHPGAQNWPEGSLTFMKKKCTEDAFFVWAYLEKRGWRGYTDELSDVALIRD